jgi:hypothetical protein
MVVDALARHWWVIGLRGLAAIIFGVALLGLAWRLRSHHQDELGRAPLGGGATAA